MRTADPSRDTGDGSGLAAGITTLCSGRSAAVDVSTVDLHTGWVGQRQVNLSAPVTARDGGTFRVTDDTGWSTGAASPCSGYQWDNVLNSLAGTVTRTDGTTYPAVYVYPQRLVIPLDGVNAAAAGSDSGVLDVVSSPVSDGGGYWLLAGPDSVSVVLVQRVNLQGSVTRTTVQLPSGLQPADAAIAFDATGAPYLHARHSTDPPAVYPSGLVKEVAPAPYDPPLSAADLHTLVGKPGYQVTANQPSPNGTLVCLLASAGGQRGLLVAHRPGGAVTTVTTHLSAPAAEATVHSCLP